MAEFRRVSRAFDRIVTAPWRIADTHRVVVANAEGTGNAFNTLDARLAVLDQHIAALGARLESAYQTELEALALLTRAVNELNSRLQDRASLDDSSDS
jgi:hypothetical protein